MPGDIRHPVTRAIDSFRTRQETVVLGHERGNKGRHSFMKQIEIRSSRGRAITVRVVVDSKNTVGNKVQIGAVCACFVDADNPLHFRAFARERFARVAARVKPP
jgi:hypothetical protein